MAINIQMKRFTGASGKPWDEMYPVTKATLVYGGANNDVPLVLNGKIQSTFLPDYLLGQMVYAGVVTSDTVDNNDYVETAGMKFFKKIQVSLTDAGKSKLGTDSNTIKLVYKSISDADGVSEFNFKDCDNCYFIFKHPEHGHVAGDTYYLFDDLDTQAVEPMLSDVVDGDWIIATADGWKKIDNTDSVISVAGKTGNVELGIADIQNLGTTLDAKAPLNNPEFTGTVKIKSMNQAGFVKTDVSGNLSVDTNSYANINSALGSFALDTTNKKITFKDAGGNNKGILTFAEGSQNGTIRITSNEANNPYFEIPVHGLGSAAYQNSNAFAAADHNHDISDINPPEDQTGKYFAFFSGADNDPEWKDIDSSDIVVTASHNGLARKTDYNTLNNLRHTGTTDPTGSAQVGDICFVEIQ